MRSGLLLDSLASFDRNRGVPASLQLPRGRVVSKSEAIDRFPGLRRRGLTGAAVWYDYTTVEADRLTFSWALAASEHGAVLANYVEAGALIREGQRILGVRAVDRESGRDIEIGARVTVNATGASLDRLLAPLGLAAEVPLLKAMNLVTHRDAGDEALGGNSAAGRRLFLVPWQRRALFGTWESSRPAGPGDTTANSQEVETFISELNQAFPSLELSPLDVSLVHRGVVPAVAAANGSVRLAGHEQIRDHSRDTQPFDGLLSIAGTKYTTARAAAEHVTNIIAAKLGRSSAPCRTASTPLPGGRSRGPRIRDGRGAPRVRRATAERLHSAFACRVRIALSRGCGGRARTPGVAFTPRRNIAGDRRGDRMGRPQRNGHKPERCRAPSNATWRAWASRRPGRRAGRRDHGRRTGMVGAADK